MGTHNICIIVSTARDAVLTMRKARRERSELYDREYDQGKVTYNEIYFQQKSLWPIFFLEVVTGSWQDWSELDTNKSREVTRNYCQ